MSAPAIAASPAPAPATWLVSPAFDLAIYSGIVLYSAVGVLALGRWVEPTRLWLAFNVVFTLAHYAPTWSRALLDRAVLREYRAQIALFPLLVLGFSYATRSHPVALLFLTFMWDRFHALMQNYGFLRLYEARRTADRVPAWLELALVFASAATVMTFNMGLLVPFLGQFYLLGLPVPARPEVVQAIRAACLSATAALAVAYGIRLWRSREGALPKLVYLASMVGGHLVMNTTSNLLLLSCHEKFYHSTQYMALGWFYNRKRAQKAAPGELGRAFRALFLAPGPVRYLIFVAVCTAATYLLVPAFGAPPGALAGPFTSLAACFALTHYYFDSFLWRVRRTDVKSNL